MDPTRQAVANMNLLQTDRSMMARCVQLARSGSAEGELPFGALVSCGETIISEAMNHSIREFDESRHAEILAIARARKTLGRRTLRECTLYSTVEPCPMCSFVIRAAGIKRVVFALHSPVMGGMSQWGILQNKPTSRRLRLLIGPAPQIVTGVLADEVHGAWNEWRPLVARAMRLFGFFVVRKSDSHP